MRFLNEAIKRMKWFDISLIKWASATGTILVFKLIPGGILVKWN